MRNGNWKCESCAIIAYIDWPLHKYQGQLLEMEPVSISPNWPRDNVYCVTRQRQEKLIYDKKTSYNIYIYIYI